MEYTPGKYLAFRAGVSTNPLNLYSVGMGLVLKTLHLDRSYSYHQLLGSSPNASILCAF